jgi:hypothetical protein
MERFDDTHELDQALKALDVEWDRQRQKKVRDQLMNEVRNMNQKSKSPIMKWVWLTTNVALFLAVAIGVYYFILHDQGSINNGPSERIPTGAQTDHEESEHMVTQSEEEEVTTVVEAFGEKLQQVSLLAPSEVVRESIEQHYSEYVTPELLSRWLDDPSSAPGRLTSSPWPERIEIVDLEEVADDVYEVQGEVIEVTSVEESDDNVANRIPITLTVKKVDNQWLIDDVVMGDEAADPLAYENTEYGFSITLPESWMGYTTVVEEWQGTDANGDEVTGPMILIRHPEWTEEHIRQDIPIMILTHEQWKAIQQAELRVGAAPIPPTELGQNKNYVFALPARYNYAFPTGYEEVEQILQSNAFQAIDAE